MNKYPQVILLVAVLWFPLVLLVWADPLGPAGVPTAEQVGPTMPGTKSAPEKRLVLKPGSLLWVKGSTSKRSFELGARVLLGSALLKSPFDLSRGGDTLLAAVRSGGVQAMSLVVPVDRLGDNDPTPADKGDYSMAGPHHTLKGKDHPYVRFRLEEVTLDKEPRDGKYGVKANGKLSIAGVTRDIRLEAKASFSGNEVNLTGVYKVRLGDYKLEPIAAIWGAMGADDPVEVHYDLVFGSVATGGASSSK